MQQQQEPGMADYPHGRGYGHDYMRGGEVHGGYGYSSRIEYEKRRGEEERAIARQTDAPDDAK